MIGYIGQNGRSELYPLKDIGQSDGQSKVELGKMEAKLEYKPLPPTRTDLGYTWNEADIHDIMESLGFYLARQKAKAYLQDVYASSGHVYRNIIIQLPKLGEFWKAENIHIMFDRDEGRQLSIQRD